MVLAETDIQNLEKEYRRNFINSLSGFKSANLCGTKNEKGQSNLSIISSVVHLGADPAMLGLVMRPPIVERHTFENIKETGFYTINHIHQNIYKAAHQTSARYPREISEFEATGLTEEYTNFFAPYVKESVVKIGMELLEIIPIKWNNTEFIIGKIVEIQLPDSIVSEDGLVNLAKAETITCTGLDAYFTVSELSRLSYAKKDKTLTEIPF